MPVSHPPPPLQTPDTVIIKNTPLHTFPKVPPGGDAILVAASSLRAPHASVQVRPSTRVSAGLGSNPPLCCTFPASWGPACVTDFAALPGGVLWGRTARFFQAPCSWVPSRSSWCPHSSQCPPRCQTLGSPHHSSLPLHPLFLLGLLSVPPRVRASVLQAVTPRDCGNPVSVTLTHAGTPNPGLFSFCSESPEDRKQHDLRERGRRARLGRRRPHLKRPSPALPQA